MAEKFAPSIVVDGVTQTPSGVEWILGFAMAGIPWAIEEAQKPGFKERLMESLKKRYFGGSRPAEDVIEKARLEERERCARIAETETEMPGPIPHEVREGLERLGMEEAHRMTCRITKENIARRIREGT